MHKCVDVKAHVYEKLQTAAAILCIFIKNNKSRKMKDQKGNIFEGVLNSVI